MPSPAAASATPAPRELPCVRCVRPEQSAAAALATVAQLHALPIGSREIAPVVGLPFVRELGDLVVASRLLGFDSVPLEGGYDDLPDVPRPNLVLFKGGHFVVLYEVDASSARIGDPLAGVRTLTRDEFTALWTGDCLQLLPTDALAAAHQKLATHRSLWKRLTNGRSAAFLVGVGAMATLVAVNGASGLSLALGLAAASSLWLVLFQSSCAQCSRAHQLAGALPLDRLGSLFYVSLLLAALVDIRFVAYPLFVAAGAHVWLLFLLARERVPCPPCLLTGAAALVGAGLVARAGSPVAVASLLAGGALLAALAVPFFRRLARQRSLRASRGAALDWLASVGEIPGGQVRVAVWKRVGCAACLFYEAIFKRALEEEYEGVVAIVEHDAAGLEIPTPLILIAGGGACTLFVGLPGRDDDYEALKNAVERASAPSGAERELQVVEPTP